MADQCIRHLLQEHRAAEETLAALDALLDSLVLEPTWSADHCAAFARIRQFVATDWPLHEFSGVYVRLMDYQDLPENKPRGRTPPAGAPARLAIRVYAARSPGVTVIGPTWRVRWKAWASASRAARPASRSQQLATASLNPPGGIACCCGRRSA